LLAGTLMINCELHKEIQGRKDLLPNVYDEVPD
jgi:hypothetical protein